MPHPRYSSSEIVERGKALYDREIHQKLADTDRGKMLVLDIETGEYELDRDEMTALMRARQKRPGAPFYVARVGHPTAFRLGKKALVVPC